MSKFTAMEDSTNILVVKVNGGLFLGGYALLAVLKGSGLITTEWLPLVTAFSITLVVFGALTAAALKFPRWKLLKFFLVGGNYIAIAAVVYLTESAMGLSPAWFVTIGISALYFTIPLTLVVSILAWLGNIFCIFTASGFEEISASQMAGNFLIFLVAASAVLFSVARGNFYLKESVDRRTESEQLSSRLQEIIQAARDTAGETYTLSQNLSSSTDQISASLEEVAASTNEFSANTQVLADKGSEMVASSREASELASQGKSDVEKALAVMDSIGTSIKQFQSSVDSLAGKTQQVDQIISQITAISDQTNLLALNAAIEAARAGEHGRGFTVVADEVRNLSEKAAASAREIGEITAAIRVEAEKATASISTEASRIEENAKVIVNSGDTFRRVIGALESIANEVQYAAAAIQDMETGSESIAAATEEQSSSLQEIAQSAASLRQSAEMLLGLLDSSVGP